MREQKLAAVLLILSKLKKAERLHLFLLIAKSGTATLGELRKATGANTNLLNRHLIALKNAWLVKLEKSRYSLTPTGERVFRTLNRIRNDPDAAEIGMTIGRL